ncbi:hypothetical protein BASA60_007410 [Batrachochytrium salamandrivorans]|nr:hypothetical protein BASA60_007410 [Batrachochytrium salamandrivorans]
MAENTPSLADAHIVRTYPNDYAPSDTESEGEAQFEVEVDDEVEVEDEEQNSVSTRFKQKPTLYGSANHNTFRRDLCLAIRTPDLENN